MSPADSNHTERSIVIRSDNAKSRRDRIIHLRNKTYRLITQFIEENEAFDDNAITRKRDNKRK